MPRFGRSHWGGAFKTGFRRPEEVENYLGLPVIASIPPFDSRKIEMGSSGHTSLLTGPKTGDKILGPAPALLWVWKESGWAPTPAQRITMLTGLSQEVSFDRKMGAALYHC